MGGTGVIDSFLEVFTRYIDSGFGLLSGEVAFLATTLAAIDITLAAIFWSWAADEDIIARLAKKTLFVGVFAYLIGNWNSLARIIFESFSGLGLKASGSSMSAADFLSPGRVAQVGIDAGRPIMDSISELMGYISFSNGEQLLPPYCQSVARMIRKRAVNSADDSLCHDMNGGFSRFDRRRRRAQNCETFHGDGTFGEEIDERVVGHPGNGAPNTTRHLIAFAERPRKNSLSHRHLLA
jgi:TrbL/VirB6 plasmid conjugal transfer protein